MYIIIFYNWIYKFMKFFINNFFILAFVFVIMCQFCVFSVSNACFDRLGLCGSLWSRVKRCCNFDHLSWKKNYSINCKNFWVLVLLGMNDYDYILCMHESGYFFHWILWRIGSICVVLCWERGSEETSLIIIKSHKWEELVVLFGLTFL